MIRLVGLTGLAGSGKGEAARRLVEAHGFTLIKFAGPLKNMMRALGLGDEEIEGSLKEKPCALLSGRTPRHAMQTLGTEWGRELIHPDLWVHAAMASVDAVLGRGGKVVLDDMRFANEAVAVRQRGGGVVKIERPSVAVSSSHVSENGQIEPDVVIENAGSLEQLRAGVDWLATGHFAR